MPGRQIARMKSPVDEVFTDPGAYAIKSIVLIDFTDVVKMARTVPSVAAQNTPVKPIILSNLPGIADR